MLNNAGRTVDAITEGVGRDRACRCEPRRPSGRRTRVCFRRSRSRVDSPSWLSTCLSRRRSSPRSRSVSATWPTGRWSPRSSVGSSRVDFLRSIRSWRPSTRTHSNGSTTRTEACGHFCAVDLPSRKAGSASRCRCCGRPRPCFVGVTLVGVLGVVPRGARRRRYGATGDAQRCGRGDGRVRPGASPRDAHHRRGDRARARMGGDRGR